MADPAIEKFGGMNGLGVEYPNAAAITPADDADMEYACRAIYVGGDDGGTAGNIALVTVNGDEVTFKLVPVGKTLRVRAARVKATGTTATDLIALW